jgi:hypothetical protein
MTNDDRKSVTAIRVQVRKLADTRGEVEAAKKLGVSTTAMLRLLAGREVRRGTLALIREAIAADGGSR